MGQSNVHAGNEQAREVSARAWQVQHAQQRHANMAAAVAAKDARNRGTAPSPAMEYATAAEAIRAIHEGKHVVGVKVTGAASLGYAYKAVVALGNVVSPNVHSNRIASLEKSHLNDLKSPQLQGIRHHLHRELEVRCKLLGPPHEHALLTGSLWLCL